MQMVSSHYSCSINNHYSTLNLNLPQVTLARPEEPPSGPGSVFLCLSLWFVKAIICCSACVRRHIGADSQQYVEVEGTRQTTVHYGVLAVCLRDSGLRLGSHPAAHPSQPLPGSAALQKQRWPPVRSQASVGASRSYETHLVSVPPSQPLAGDVRSFSLKRRAGRLLLTNLCKLAGILWAVRLLKDERRVSLIESNCSTL